jgi:hypothetical protein
MGFPCVFFIINSNKEGKITNKRINISEILGFCKKMDKIRPVFNLF